MTKDELTAILFRALQSRLGIQVATSNPENLRNKLYAIRRANELFEPLSFSIPPEPETLLILNRTEIDNAKEAG